MRNIKPSRRTVTWQTPGRNAERCMDMEARRGGTGAVAGVAGRVSQRERAQQNGPRRLLAACTQKPTP